MRQSRQDPVMTQPKHVIPPAFIIDPPSPDKTDIPPLTIMTKRPFDTHPVPILQLEACVLPASPPAVGVRRVSFLPQDTKPQTSISAMRKGAMGRDSAYYASLAHNRSLRDVTAEEREFGWAGSARHFRKSRMNPIDTSISANVPAVPPFGEPFWLSE